MLSATSSSGSNPLVALIPFLLLGGLFYFMIWRPQKRRQQAQQALVSSVDVGDEILIAGAGIYGTITSIDDDEGTVTVRIAPGTEIKMLRGGIARRVMEDEAYDDDDESYDEADDEDHEDHPEQPGQIKEL